jgi:hypothetical protein
MLKILDHVLYIPSFSADIKIDIFIYQVQLSGNGGINLQIFQFKNGNHEIYRRPRILLGKILFC